MSEDDGHGSGCETVDGSPASDSSQSHSPYLESRYLGNHNHQSLDMTTRGMDPENEPSKLPVRTMVVPPMRVVQNNNNMDQHTARTGQFLFGEFHVKIVSVLTVRIGLYINLLFQFCVMQRPG